MILEQEIKYQCTPEFIKRACEYAQGFEYKFFKDFGNRFDWSEVIHTVLFPLLIHRAIEGWNKKVKSKKNYIVIGSNATMIWSDNINECKDYVFKNYQPQSLTQVECACLHCLLDIFKGKEVTECKHPNHCEQLRQAGENLIKQELKIKELEQQKAELIKFVKKIDNSFDYDECPVVKRQIKDLLKKYSEG